MVHTLLFAALVCAFASEPRDDELRAELERARRALAKARGLVPRLQSLVQPGAAAAVVAGYQGYTYVGASSAIRKSYTVMLWGTSAVVPVVRDVILQQPIDKLICKIERVMLDSFVMTVERVDGKVGWGQELWATYYVEGRFAKVEQPEWASPSAANAHSPVTAGQELSELLDSYFAQPVTRAPACLPVPTAAPAMLPLLRHLGGNFANVENLWHMLISAHPQPSRAVVVEVGVADGTPSMYAAELGVRVLAVEPNRKWVDSPPLVAKAHARRNLEIIHAAASSSDGHASFTGGGTGGHVVHGRRLSSLKERFFKRGDNNGRGGGKNRGRTRVAIDAHPSDGGQPTEVPSLMLDSILRDRNISHVYLVKIDVQGFELEVLRGLVRALREQRVLYVLLEFWPRGMNKHGLDAHEVLQLLHGHGYTLFDTRGLRLGSEGSLAPLSAASTFRRPVGLRANVDWYLDNDARHHADFGYWTDVLAVASGAELNLDLF